MSLSPRIRCFNARYSPNLGDGLLSECLEHQLIALGAAPDTASIDLAARGAYGDVMAGRGTIMAVLDALPGPARRAAVRLPLALQARRRWQPHYRAGLRGAEAVAIGGGNLLADLDLNFPTKLSLALGEARKRGLPAAIYACGMSGGWSATGLRMARRAFANGALKAVFLRDTASRDLWAELMQPHTGIAAEVVRDPGLLAARVFPAARPDPRPRPVAGIGLMSHLAIRYHAEAAPEADQLDDWFVGLGRALLDAGFDLRVFTNGSPEDVSYAARLRPRLAALAGPERIAFPTQRTPAELCGHIADLDVLVAYRLHAVIAATSYGVPAIGLAWDRKLASFLDSIGAGDRLLDVTRIAPGAAAERMVALARQPRDKAARQALLREAAEDVGRLYAALAGASSAAR
ncbi:polysaccharide pyruvyl transferase family protein (plasmid) [Limimaricola variabilis]|uniref:polysaccharide pyruvyl transferase family protein n=1 Tax=Limimaricola variabilis TaxID=1492771 RepID=UPI002AC9B2C6|nr:polysaccharide pyruvyl transferase family protein [Limimaricola variabilis]WPY96664.1 polysaccharide pyruvyl transferase family protein [Limimaricola variabilis]